MKTLLLSIVFLLAFVLTALAQPTIYLVRHAEKLANWPDDEALEAFQPLSPEGMARAQKLAEQFKPGSVAAVFSSRTTRTLHTALSLAPKLVLPIEVVDACMDTAAIAAFYKGGKTKFPPVGLSRFCSHQILTFSENVYARLYWSGDFRFGFCRMRVDLRHTNTAALDERDRG